MEPDGGARSVRRDASRRRIAATTEERQQFLGWLEPALETVDFRRTSQPGRVTIRRLNRAEYNNTIRDLLGVDFRPADDFPADDVGNGFDNIAEVLCCLRC